MRRPRFLVQALLAIMVSLVPSSAHAGADLRIQFGALQRLLAEQGFTTEGRRYLKGTKATPCSFAFLETPQIDGTPDGHLRIRARFSGRSALNVVGHCIGFGDDFNLTVTATPYYQNGAIKLKDVRVDPAKKGFYADRVCKALSESLPEQFAYPAADEARRALQTAPSPSGYSRRVQRFEVTKLEVTADALVLTLDFELVIGG
jgi:hypothetical protein